MDAAVQQEERGGAPAVSLRSELGPFTSQDLGALVVGLVATALFCAWSAVDGGFAPTWWLPGGLLLVGLAVVTVVGVKVDLLALPRPLLVALAAFAGLTAWSYLSLLWAEVPGDAWDGANRTLVYLLVFVVFALLPWRAGTASLVLAAYVAALAGVGFVAFADIVANPDARDFMGGRLANPTGYQNANAALFMMAFGPAVVAGSRRGVPIAIRVAALAAATFLAQLAFLCQSRGAFFALPVLALALLVLLPGRLRSLLALGLPLAGVALVTRPLLDVYAADENTRLFARALPPAAWWMLGSAAGVGLATAVWAVLDRRLTLSPRTGRTIGAVCLAGVMVLTVVAVPRLDAVDRLERGWSQFTGSTETDKDPGSSYLAYGLSGNRYDLWSVAFRQFRAKPVLGAGADNFATAYLRERRYDEEPHYPHSLELRMLGGLGLVGGVLCLLVVAGILAVALRLRSASARDRAVITAALLPFMWWLAHGSIDWFWEFPALSGPALAFAAMAGAIRPGSTAQRSPAGARRMRVTAIAVTGLAGVALVALVPPWLAARHVATAQATWRSDPEAAYRALDRARALNPLSDEADVVTGAIAARRRDDGRARVAFERALRRNPANWYATMELGLLESVAGRRAESLRLLARAHELNPLEGLLPGLADRVRAGERIHPSTLDRLFLEESRGLLT